jgi:hypothetical protein
MCAEPIFSECLDSRLFYYDFIADERKGSVPEKVLRHIAQCQHCRAEIHRLKEQLESAGNAEGDTKSLTTSYLVSILKLHFAFIDKPVNCSAVKPFLPMLAVLALEIKIPTPITVHLDHCLECSNDLLTLQSLGLTENQLIRFAQFLAHLPLKEPLSCRKIQSSMPLMLSGTAEVVNAQVLMHINICSRCRKVFYQYWDSILSALSEKKGVQSQMCEEFSKEQLFNYCFPYDIDFSLKDNILLRSSVTSHLRQCPECLNKMLNFHKTIYDITVRPDSETLTYYSLQGKSKSSVKTGSEKTYGDFPITVNATGSTKQKITAARYQSVSSGAIKRVSSPTRLKRYLAPAIASVAAVILIVSVLFFSTPFAKAVTFEEVFEAISGINNAYVVNLMPGRSEPLQEIWTSRSSNISLYKTGEQFVLWDFKNKVKKTKYISSETVNVAAISGEKIAEAEKTMINSLGLTPFTHLSDLPSNAIWSEVTDEETQLNENTKIYDLTWTVQSIDLTWDKWRFYINTETNLPQKLELYFKVEPEKDFRLSNYMVITHPTDEQIQATIEEVFK